MRTNPSGSLGIIFFSTFYGNSFKAPRLIELIKTLTESGVDINCYGIEGNEKNCSVITGSNIHLYESAAIKILFPIIRRLLDLMGQSSAARYLFIYYLTLRSIQKGVLGNRVIYTQAYFRLLIKLAKRRNIYVVVESDCDHPKTMWELMRGRSKRLGIPFWQREPPNFFPYIVDGACGIDLADRVIVFSKKNAETFIDNGISPSKLIRSVPPVYFADNSIDPIPRFLAPSFIWVGNHGVRKGIDVLYEAWRSYKILGGVGELILCGSCSRATKKIRYSLGQLPSVSDLGSTDLQELYAGGNRCIVMPSLSEGVPRAVIAAMAAGLVPLGTISGTGGLVEHGENGWVVDLCPESLTLGLFTVERDWNDIPTLGRRAQQTVERETANFFFDVSHILTERLL